MAFNTQWDGYQVQTLGLPYDRSTRELDETHRIVSGENMYVTTGGKLAKRPGTIFMFNAGANFTRVDRLWLLESMDATPTLFFIASVYNAPTHPDVWSLWAKQVMNSLSSSFWTDLGTYRDINSSQQPHEAVAARGKLYVKGFPFFISAEKLGTVVLEIDAGPVVAVRPWGLLGPTTPARIKGAVTKLSAAATAGAGSITVPSNTGFPATPFVIQVNYEQMNVTASAGAGPFTWTVTRGYNNTTAEAHSANSPVIWRNWSSSDHIVTVNQFWRYAYAYKTITGHISNRSPEETNPDLMPSRTGPFFDQCPQVIITGTADTTNVPTIVIYRSTDGGGTFYKLTEVNNPGFSTFTFTDNLLASGAASSTFNDPTPDSVLDTADVAPSLTSNSPPPTVLSPKVVGVDFPDYTATKPVYFQGRIWFAVGNYVFFSANEELGSGVPEEAFPSGLTGNFFRYQHRVANLEATTNSLYVGTSSGIHVITGSNRETFASNPLYEQYGFNLYHRRSTCRFGENIAILTNDYRVMIISPQGIRTISDPLSTDITDLLSVGADIEIKYWTDTDKEWLVIAVHRANASAQSKVFVYDLKRSLKEDRDFWFTPWSLWTSCLYSGQIYTDDSRKELMIASYNASNAYFVKLDRTGATFNDYNLGSTAAVSCFSYFSLVSNPNGNHVNTLREPGLTSVIERIIVERTKFTSDTDPGVSYRLDAFYNSGTSVSVSGVDPARRAVSVGYKTQEYHIYKACQRIGLLISHGFANQFELQNIAYIWQPESGA